MKSIELENLRAIRKSGKIELNNLNVFLGANSTGKSTILRFFPLIKQTLSRNNDTPLLWYDPEGVDFGSFMESVFAKDHKNSISYTFGFENIDIDLVETSFFEQILNYHFIENESLQKNGFYHGYVSYRFKKDHHTENIIDDVSVKITINGDQNVDKNDDKYVGITVLFNNNEIEFDIKNSCIKIEDRLITFPKDIQFQPVGHFHNLMPDIILTSKSGKEKDRLVEVILKRLAEIMFENIDPRISTENKMMLLLSLKYSSNKNEFLERAIKKTKSKTLQKTFIENLDYIYDHFTILSALFSIHQLNEILQETFLNISYIAPIRATAERYYRVQGLSVLDVDSMGTNVPMILNTMSPSERRNWKTWTRQHFNMEFDTFQEGGHIAINVKKNDDEMYNLADTGFGYSQILPVLLVIWKQKSYKNKSRRKKRFFRDYNVFDESENEKNIIIIEQPELHLHPAMQAKIADMLIEIIKSYPQIQFIIETHSVEIMNRIGQHIEYNNASKKPLNLEEKINIFLVNPLSDDSKNVVQTSYDSEGIIEKWPVGFLSGGIL